MYGDAGNPRVSGKVKPAVIESPRPFRYYGCTSKSNRHCFLSISFRPFTLSQACRPRMVDLVEAGVTGALGEDTFAKCLQVWPSRGAPSISDRECLNHACRGTAVVSAWAGRWSYKLCASTQLPSQNIFLC